MTQGEEIKLLRDDMRIALAALNDIAAWNEGSKVDGSFDEPASAKRARAALNKILITGMNDLCS